MIFTLTISISLAQTVFLEFGDLDVRPRGVIVKGDEAIAIEEEVG